MNPAEVFLTEEDWLKSRRKGIGGTDAAAILGFSNWASPFSVWLDKTERLDSSAGRLSSRARMGKALEPVVADLFAQERKIEFLPLSPMHQFVNGIARCTVDRLFQNGSSADPRVLEIKTASVRAKGWGNGEIPLIYQIQVQHQLMVLGLSQASVALLRDNELRITDVEVDPLFLPFLKEREEQFWDLVQRDTPPAVDDSLATKKALELLYPDPRQLSVNLSHPFMEKAQRRAEIASQLRTLETEKRGIDNEIKAALQGAEYGVLPDGSGFSYKEITRKPSPGFTYRQLRSVKRPRGTA